MLKCVRINEAFLLTDPDRSSMKFFHEASNFTSYSCILLETFYAYKSKYIPLIIFNTVSYIACTYLLF